jgi:hypothetical protein
MAEGPRCLYYALGGGLGHGMRSLALARQIVRSGGGHQLLLFNSPFAPALLSAVAPETGIAAQSLSPDAGPDQAGQRVKEALNTFRPELFVIDTFPRGLGGELATLLPDCSARCVLISRGLPRGYVERYDLAPFVSRHYHLVIAPGEPSPFEGVLPVHRTRPFLVRDWEELPGQDEAARRLGTCVDRPVLLLVGSGTLPECAEVARWAERLAKVWANDLPPLRLALPPGIAVSAGSVPTVMHCPLLECLPAVRLLVGGGAGYNLVHEAGALAVPALYRPRKRKYDDQLARLPLGACFADFRELQVAIHRELQLPRPSLSRYANGAAEAGRLVLSST